MATVRIEGLRDLDRALAELPKATAKNTLKRTLLKGAAPVAAKAKENAPHESGELDTSIHVGTQLTPRQRERTTVLTADGFRSSAKNYVEVYVGTLLSRGMFTNFGTFKDAPQFWFDHAWGDTQNEALEIIQTDLGTEIEKSAARLARKAARA